MSTVELRQRSVVRMVVSFVDLTRYRVESRARGDDEVAAILDAYYCLVAARVGVADGNVVKFMGDAALIVFPEAAVEPAVTALLGLKHEVDEWLEARGWSSRLLVKVHLGEVVAGPFGPPGQQHYDVVGTVVNEAALLPTRGVTLSAAVVDRLGPALRDRFEEHAPPVVYIGREDPS